MSTTVTLIPSCILQRWLAPARDRAAEATPRKSFCRCGRQLRDRRVGTRDDDRRVGDSDQCVGAAKGRERGRMPH
jgi:hypothetical protein